jgi:hypothetical protein
VSTKGAQNLAYFKQFDGIFLSGSACDNHALIQYVLGGGNVYLCGGTGIGGATAEARRWNTFLLRFGFEFAEGQYSGSNTIKEIGASKHYILSHLKVDTLYYWNGNAIRDISPNGKQNEILISIGSGGAIGVFDGSISLKEPEPEPEPTAGPPSMVRICVGEAGWEEGPHRCMINHDSVDQPIWNEGKMTMNIDGWEHLMSFKAFAEKQAGTIRIAVGQVSGPHRCMINHQVFDQEKWNEGQSMSIEGWEHKQEFWVYPTKQPGTIRIAVGYATPPHRIMINHKNHGPQSKWDEGQLMDMEGWTHQMDFWAFPCD